MASFTDIAYRILKETGKPLHSKEIATIAMKKGLLKTNGKTPEATMNASLTVDINSAKGKSRFLKVAPSTFGINKNFKEITIKKKLQNNEKLLSEDFVKHAIIKWLSSNGWGHFKYGDKRERGVDIKAKHHKYPRYFFVETKGEGNKQQSNEGAFVYSLGQIITRMKSKAKYYYALGLPEASAKIALRRLPWQVAKKLSLYLFSVNQSGEVMQYSWKELKKLQKLKKQ